MGARALTSLLAGQLPNKPVSEQVSSAVAGGNLRAEPGYGPEGELRGWYTPGPE